MGSEACKWNPYSIQWCTDILQPGNTLHSSPFYYFTWNSCWGHLTVGNVGHGPKNCKGEVAPKGVCPPTPFPHA